MPSRRVLLVAATLAVALLYSLWSARPLWADLWLLAALALAVRLTWPGGPVPLARPALAVLAAFSVASLGSVDPLASWRVVSGLVAYGLVFLLAGNLLAQGVSKAELYRALVLAGQVMVAAYFAVWVRDGARLTGYRLLVENVNSMALVNLLLMPALLTGELRGLVLAESLFVAWVSGSRAGLLGLVGGLAVAFFRRRQAALWPGLFVAALSVGAVASRARSDLFLANGRAEMWAVAARMFADSPLIGQGPATFKAWWLAADLSAYAFGHAHSLYLNLAAETGLLGLAACAWLGVAAVRALPRDRLWASAARAGTVGLLILSLFDVPTTAPYITVAWLVVLQLGLTPDDSA